MGSSAQESLTAAIMRAAQSCFTVTPRERIYAISLMGRRVAILYPPTRVTLLRTLWQDAAAVTSIRAPTCARCDSTLSSCSAPGAAAPGALSARTQSCWVHLHIRLHIRLTKANRAKNSRGNHSHRILRNSRTIPAIWRNLSFFLCFRAIRARAVSSGSCV